jgi:hypothetical protein
MSDAMIATYADSRLRKESRRANYPRVRLFFCLSVQAMAMVPST